MAHRKMIKHNKLSNHPFCDVSLCTGIEMHRFEPLLVSKKSPIHAPTSS